MKYIVINQFESEGVDLGAKTELSFPIPLVGKVGREEAVKSLDKIKKKIDDIFSKITQRKRLVVPKELQALGKMPEPVFDTLETLARDLGIDIKIYRGFSNKLGTFVSREKKGLLHYSPSLVLREDVGGLRSFVIGHESGHYIDSIISKGKFKLDFSKEIIRSKEVRDELLDLSRILRPFDEATVSKTFIKYRKNAKELFADFTSVYFKNPELAQRSAPKFFAIFEDKIAAHPEITKHIDSISRVVRSIPETPIRKPGEPVNLDLLALELRRIMNKPISKVLGTELKEGEDFPLVRLGDFQTQTSVADLNNLIRTRLLRGEVTPEEYTKMLQIDGIRKAQKASIITPEQAQEVIDKINEVIEPPAKENLAADNKRGGDKPPVVSPKEEPVTKDDNFEKEPKKKSLLNRAYEGDT
ncbi:MAG: hypothetical protein AABY22_20090, partial [Nanoarchaeota archaeon]